jgi:hypothetical protein
LLYRLPDEHLPGIREHRSSAIGNERDVLSGFQMAEDVKRCGSLVMLVQRLDRFVNIKVPQKPLALVVIGGALILAVVPRLLQPALLVLAHREPTSRPGA